MFRVLNNECIFKFDLKAIGPISIRSGENMDLDPTLPDDRFIRSHHDGKYDVIIPGSSIKGVFRSRIEKILDNCCDIFDNSSKCSNAGKKYEEDIQKRYLENCPACRLFGSRSLRSRIEFKDAYPIENTVKLSTRHNVGIDRVTGAAKKATLFQPEVLEEGIFSVEFVVRNFFLWQIKVLLQVINDINEGYVVFGGITSRGFGRMSAENVRITVRDYRIKDSLKFYEEKAFSLDEMMNKISQVLLNEKELEKVNYDEYIL